MIGCPLLLLLFRILLEVLQKKLGKKKRKDINIMQIDIILFKGNPQEYTKKAIRTN